MTKRVFRRVKIVKIPDYIRKFMECEMTDDAAKKI